MSFTIERVRYVDIYDPYYGFFLEEVSNIKPYSDKFNFRNFNLPHYAFNNLFWVCHRGDTVLGVMMARLYPSIWEPNKKVLFQDLLYTKKSSGKAAYLLLKEFIDFGRANASLVFTCRTPYTNIKENSLAKLGFKKSEEIYLLEG